MTKILLCDGPHNGSYMDLDEEPEEGDIFYAEGLVYDDAYEVVRWPAVFPDKVGELVGIYMDPFPALEEGDSIQLENTSQRITNVHPENDECRTLGCAVHNPTDHHMRSWPQHFRDPRDPFSMHPGLMERTCPHGVGHPDPDHMNWYRRHKSSEDVEAEGVHGCDGCCSPPDGKREDA